MLCVRFQDSLKKRGGVLSVNDLIFTWQDNTEEIKLNVKESKSRGAAGVGGDHGAVTACCDFYIDSNRDHMFIS